MIFLIRFILFYKFIYIFLAFLYQLLINVNPFYELRMVPILGVVYLMAMGIVSTP